MTIREHGMGMVLILPAAELIDQLVEMLPDALSRVMPIHGDLGGKDAWVQYVSAHIADPRSELNSHIDLVIMDAMEDYFQAKVRPFLRTARPVRIEDSIVSMLLSISKGKIQDFLKEFGDFGEGPEGMLLGHEGLYYVRKHSALYLLPAVYSFLDLNMEISAEKIEQAEAASKPTPTPASEGNVIAFPRKKAKPKPPPKNPKPK